MLNNQNYDEWMQIAEAQKRGASGHDGDGCLAVFYTRAVLDLKATELEGRPIYNSVPFVQIRIPGDPRSVVDQRVTEQDRLRWPAPWAAYEARKKGAVDGTPIESFPLLTATDVATLRHCGVLTVEQLAAVSDGNLRNLGPGASKLRERARQHLKGPEDTEKDLRAQVQKQQAEISDLQAKLHQLMGAVSVRTADHDDHDDEIAESIEDVYRDAEPARRPRGRPRKVQA